MEFLRFLEGLRSPVGDVFFSLVTHFGAETLFIVAALLFFWCIDKLAGYYLLAIGVMGTLVNQFLKLWFRIPRPWVLDPEFTIVESARAGATGYSFPSGHTQTAVGVYGGLMRWFRDKRLRAVCLALCVLVPLSRMYLGVHTPLDVGVSVLAALVLVFALYPVMRRENGQRPVFLAMTALALVYLAFVSLYPFPADVDPVNLASGTKNAWTMLGCTLGVWLGYEVDERHTHFEVKAVWWAQVLKLALGLGLMLGIKSGLKQPLYALLGEHLFVDGLRYFLMAAFGACVWPMTFRFFAGLGRKQKS